MIQQFKFVKKVNTVNWFYDTLSGNGRDPVRPGTRAFNRSHQYQMNSQFTRIDRRVHFFTNRVVNDWNELTSNVVSAETVNMFKNRLDKFRKSKKVTVIASPWPDVDGIPASLITLLYSQKLTK